MYCSNKSTDAIPIATCYYAGVQTLDSHDDI